MMIYFGKRPLGRNIRRLRRKHGLSLKQLSRQAAVPYLLLLCIEARILRDIHHDHLNALCQTFRTTQEELMGKL